MTEQGYFQSGSNKLFYTYSNPSEQIKKTGIIFVHAANGSRLGPHRMFVELAHRLNNLGFATMRFDLTGCGDSTGMVCGDDIKSDIKDVAAAVGFFMSKPHMESICLLGISRGARVIFSTIARHQIPVKSAILLSTPVSTAKAAARSFSIRLREYFHKSKDYKNIKKLLTGRVNIKQVMKTLTTALALSRRYSKSGNKTFASKCPILFIYGQNDPTATDSKSFYSRVCRQHNIPHECIIIRQANHSFFHYKWKEQISEQVETWLKKGVNRYGAENE